MIATRDPYNKLYSHSVNVETNIIMRNPSTEDQQQLEFDFMKNVEKKPDEGGVEPTFDTSNPKKTKPQNPIE